MYCICSICMTPLFECPKYYEIKLNGVRQITNVCDSCFNSSTDSYDEKDFLYAEHLLKRKLTHSDINTIKNQGSIMMIDIKDRNYMLYLNNIKIIEDGVCKDIFEDTEFLNLFDIYPY